MDRNHAEIVAALRSAGWVVVDTSRVGHGFPDLLVAKHGVLALVEVKDGAKSPSRRRRTADEEQFAEVLGAGGVPVYVVTSIRDALRL